MKKLVHPLWIIAVILVIAAIWSDGYDWKLSLTAVIFIVASIVIAALTEKKGLSK